MGPSVDFIDQVPGGLGETLITVDTPTVTFDVEAEDDAVSIRFAVDGVVKDTVNANNALFTWEINTADEQVSDGTYVVSVTAFDEEGTPGPTRSRTLRLNRLIPSAPQDVFGGWNSRAGYAVQRHRGDPVGAQPRARRDRLPRLQGGRHVGPPRVRLHAPAHQDRVPGPPPPSTGVPLEYYVVAYDKDPFTGRPARGQPVRPASLPGPRDDAAQPAAGPNASVDGDTVVLDWDDAPAASPDYTGST